MRIASQRRSPRQTFAPWQSPRAIFDDGSHGLQNFAGSSSPPSASATNLFHVIGDTVFAHLDILAQRLIELAKEPHLAVTQQQLASELGTAREAVSRRLNEFQRRGWLTLMRGGMDITDRNAIARLATEG